MPVGAGVAPDLFTIITVVEGAAEAVVEAALGAGAAGVGPLKPDGKAFAELRGSRWLVG